MTSTDAIHSSVSNLLNGIRKAGSPYYQQTVPEYTSKTLINNYGAIVLGKNVIRNEFIHNFEQLALFEATKQHIFESPFSKRFKKKSDVGRAKTFTTFVNPINPLQYDGEAMDRILHLYRRDVKTAYFYRNREDIFPVSINVDSLASAFQSEEALYQFVKDFYMELTNSNAIVEWNAIKQLFATNAQYGALKKVNLHGKTIDEKWAIIKEYMLNMQMPSSDYNNYINIEGAVGDPVTTFTPKEDLLLIPNSKFITAVELKVMAAAFQLEYAKAIDNIIPVNDFGYNIYDRQNQEILGYEKSNIECILCDEAILRFDEDLSASNEMVNAATRVQQHFWHVWQKIQLLPWANCIVFVDEPPETFTANFQPTPILSTDVPVKLQINDSMGADISAQFKECETDVIGFKTKNGDVSMDGVWEDITTAGITDSGDQTKILNHLLDPTNNLVGVTHTVPDSDNYIFRTSDNVLQNISSDSYTNGTGKQIVEIFNKKGINTNSVIIYELTFNKDSTHSDTVNLYTGMTPKINQDLVKSVIE